MEWYWYVAIALQLIADVFFFVLIVLLVLAQSTLSERQKLLTQTMLEILQNANQRHDWTNANVKRIAQFLIAVFGLEAPPVNNDPAPPPPSSSNLKN